MLWQNMIIEITTNGIFVFIPQIPNCCPCKLVLCGGVPVYVGY